MRQGSLSTNFWAEAVNTACYIRNRCSTRSLNGQIPYKIWKGRVPTATYFQVFGARVFVLNKSRTKGKFDSRSMEGIFVGCSTKSKAYRVWMPKMRAVIESRDVKFIGGPTYESEYKEFIFEPNNNIEKLSNEQNSTEEHAVNDEEKS